MIAVAPRRTPPRCELVGLYLPSHHSHTLSPRSCRPRALAAKLASGEVYTKLSTFRLFLYFPTPFGGFRLSRRLALPGPEASR